MNIFALLISEILYRPIFNILVIFLAIFGGNLWIAIILLTITVRLLMVKQTFAGNDMQKGMSNLQPKLTEIQEKHKDDPKKLSEETMKVFKSDGKWAFKGCLMMLIQIPVFLGLYYVIRMISAGDIPVTWLYSFFNSFGVHFVGSTVLTAGAIKTTFLGMNLLAQHNRILTILAGIFTFFQTKFTTLAQPKAPTMPGSNTPDMSKMMGSMNYFLVGMIALVVWQMKAAVGLYLVTTTLFSVCQYGYQYRALLSAKWQEWTAGSKGVVVHSKK